MTTSWPAASAQTRGRVSTAMQSKVSETVLADILQISLLAELEMCGIYIFYYFGSVSIRFLKNVGFGSE